MPELAIIADDLTGALDAAAPFAMRSISTVVALRPAALAEAIATGARVVGVSTDSRELSPVEARDTVRATLAALPEGTRLFKKIDSRLKGNIVAELDAIPHVRSLVIPAIPAFGRLVREGMLGGFGVADPIAVAARLGAHAVKASIPDIASDADIAAALATPHDLPIGARGLAEAMARTMAPDASAPDTLLRNPRAYLVIGSTDPITLAQLGHLRMADPGLAYFAAPNGNGPAELPAPARLTVIQATPGATVADGRSVAIALADTLVRLAPPAGSLLVLSGGASAQAILERLGVHVLHLVGEALPGLPLATGGGLTFVTKSGGFGGAETLQQLLQPFHAEEARIA
jgi:uncharacterized protein YgbK (DUF1537 family)